MTAELTDRQRAALHYIVRRPRCLLKHLGFELGVTAGTAWFHADALRLKGLIQRRGLVATEAGAAALAEAVARHG